MATRRSHAGALLTLAALLLSGPDGLRATTQQADVAYETGTPWAGDPGIQGRQVLGRVAAMEATGPAADDMWLNFQGISYGSETTVNPPDIAGDIGPTHSITAVNGRIRLAPREHGTPANCCLSETLSTFFSGLATGHTPVMPRIRYDRRSQRWIIVAVTGRQGTSGPYQSPNRILIAVSSGPTIDSFYPNHFTYYQFQHDVPGGSPNVDSGFAAWYPKLAVDDNAIYIGADIYDVGVSPPRSVGSSVYVIRKSALLTSNSLVVTAFRGLGAGSTNAMYEPMPADNDDTSVSAAYVVGVDRNLFSRLIVRRLINTGATPSISAAIPLSVSATAYPVPQVHRGATVPLDSVDDAITSAQLKADSAGEITLWATHSIAVDNRNMIRYYGIRNLTNPVVAVTRQIDPGSAQGAGWIIPTAAVTGQGRYVAGATYADGATYPSAAILGQDAVSGGDLRTGLAAPGSHPFNIAPGNISGPPRQPWGHYSSTRVDPLDNQSVWTFQQYTWFTNYWAVRVTKITSPPPAIPISASTNVAPGRSAVDVTVRGASVDGAAFFDSGAGYPQRLTASISGNVTVNSVTVVNATTVALNISTVGASTGVRTVTITNPDGQSASGDVLFVGNAALPSPAALMFTGTNNGGVLSPITAPQSVTVTANAFTNPSTITWSATADQPWVQISGGSGTGSGTFTVGIINPQNVLGASTDVTAVVTLTATNVVHPPQTIAVRLLLRQTASFSAPFGQVDTPAQNTGGIVGAIGVTGWALDDLGVSSVKIYRNCLPFDNPASCQTVGGQNVVFVGDAAFLSGARPDVESAFPQHPMAYRAGWGYLMMTSMLPHVTGQQAYGGVGSLTLFAFATDVEGNVTLLGRSTADHSPTEITLANDTIAKPFGAIDTPRQGETVNGVLNNFGWALTPDGNTTAGDAGDILIPTNGSTMFVFIDGQPVAPIAYNQCRGTVGNPVPPASFCNDDVANIFGNTSPLAALTARTGNPTRYRNLDAGRAAIGAYQIQTSTLSNGLHTIAWSVTDSAGRTEGIGSRFFSVLNSSSGVVTNLVRPLAVTINTIK